MRIAVTGAAGLVGGQVVGAARSRGHEVRAVVRTRRRGAEVEQVRADLSEPDTLVAAFTGTEAVVHCAAVYAFGAAHAEEVARVNTTGTTHVVAAAARAGARRVVVTSSSVTRGSSELPTQRDERDELGAEPAPAYYASKVAQEQAALSAGERHGIEVVLALPTVVLGGPYGRLAPSTAIVLRYLLDPTRSTYPGGCNVVDARDVGSGHLDLLERGEPGTRYLLGGEDVTWRLLHATIADLAGLPGPFAQAPAEAAWAASAVAEGWARLTGGEPLSTREEATTVGRYYWYRSARAAQIGYAARPARAAVASALAWLVIGPDLPRWAREGLRLAPEVRAARPLVPVPLEPVSRPPRPARPASPRRPH